MNKKICTDLYFLAKIFGKYKTTPYICIKKTR